jgi:hypothetical protein
MNELGLTRESIREEMQKIVTETVERTFNSTQMQSLIRSIIEAKIQTAINPYRYASGDLEKIVKAEVEKEARKQVVDLIKGRMVVNLSLVDEPEAG